MGSEMCIRDRINTVSSSVQAPEGAPATTPVAEQGATPAAVPAGSRLRFEPADVSRRVPLQFGSAGGAWYPPAVPVDSVGTSLPTPNARPWRRVGITSTQSAEQVPVEYLGKHVPAELSLPNQRERGVISVHVVLNAGAHLTSLSVCLLYTSPSPRDGLLSRMPSSA